MSHPGPTIELAVRGAGAPGADALRRVGDLLAGLDLTPAMGRWTRRLAATFSSWHDEVFSTLETHAASLATDPNASADATLDAVVALTRGLGPRVGREGVVPVAVAMVELAGSFESVFEPLRDVEPARHANLMDAADLVPAPFGSNQGVTARFAGGAVAVAAKVVSAEMEPAAVRAFLALVDDDMIDAVVRLREVGSSSGTDTPTTHDREVGAEQARVSALAAVLSADPEFCAQVALLSPASVDGASSLAAAALDATEDFAVVARPDERIAAGTAVAVGGFAGIGSPR